ncbi:PREDICTED: uncharacterized protein LOC109292549 isoform X4 [Gavialis gangeticus]|uniref:uncharacterized protein LOC109292549 isoform X4 n=1 Tax=Gavialis gangeticus TaxID=94835 RepID=UPI00092F24AB|nr:PREDICTED: uncharacterized protein LOC109292549 isoform X4 [Gavialis gangeticus]
MSELPQEGAPTGKTAVQGQGRPMLPLCRKVCYAIGGSPYQMTGSALGFFLQIFLLDVAQLKPFHVSLILFLGQAWDAVTDPAIGFLDRLLHALWSHLLLHAVVCALWHHPSLAEVPLVPGHVLLLPDLQDLLSCALLLTDHVPGGQSERPGLSHCLPNGGGGVQHAGRLGHPGADRGQVPCQHDPDLCDVQRDSAEPHLRGPHRHAGKHARGIYNCLRGAGLALHPVLPGPRVWSEGAAWAPGSPGESKDTLLQEPEGHPGTPVLHPPALCLHLGLPGLPGCPGDLCLLLHACQRDGWEVPAPGAHHAGRSVCPSPSPCSSKPLSPPVCVSPPGHGFPLHPRVAVHAGAVWEEDSARGAVDHHSCPHRYHPSDAQLPSLCRYGDHGGMQPGCPLPVTLVHAAGCSG